MVRVAGVLRRATRLAHAQQGDGREPPAATMRGFLTRHDKRSTGGAERRSLGRIRLTQRVRPSRTVTEARSARLASRSTARCPAAGAIRTAAKRRRAASTACAAAAPPATAPRGRVRPAAAPTRSASGARARARSRQRPCGCAGSSDRGNAGVGCAACAFRRAETGCGNTGRALSVPLSSPKASSMRHSSLY